MTPLSKLGTRAMVTMKVREAHQRPISIIFSSETAAETSGIRKGVIGHLFQSPRFIIAINSTTIKQIKYFSPWADQLPSHDNFTFHCLHLSLLSRAHSGPICLSGAMATASQVYSSSSYIRLPHQSLEWANAQTKPLSYLKSFCGPKALCHSMQDPRSLGSSYQHSSWTRAHGLTPTWDNCGAQVTARLNSLLWENFVSSFVTAPPSGPPQSLVAGFPHVNPWWRQVVPDCLPSQMAFGVFVKIYSSPPQTAANREAFAKLQD